MYSSEFNAAIAALSTFKAARNTLAAVNEDPESVTALDALTILDACLAARDAFQVAAAVLEVGAVGNRSLRNGE